MNTPSTSMFSTPPERRLPSHGGDLAWADARFGKPAGGWLDLSTGVNPESYPVPDLPIAAWSRLPTGGDLATLIGAAADAYGAPSDAVVPAAGSEAVLSLLPRLLAPTKVAILAPSYSSHATAWKAAGHRIQGLDVETVLAGRLGEARILVICNPNNPDGTRFHPERLIALADDLFESGGLLVVDETFADGEPKTSVAAQTGREGLVVFRSIGKFYGLAGLRLGFALAAPRLADALREGLGAWPVSGPACRIGTAALRDTAWREAAKTRLKERGAALDSILDKTGLSIAGSTLLFRLVRRTGARTLFNRLGEKGILTRAFIERSDWLRMGIPDEANLPRLAAALDAIRSGP